MPRRLWRSRPPSSAWCTPGTRASASWTSGWKSGVVAHQQDPVHVVADATPGAPLTFPRPGRSLTLSAGQLAALREQFLGRTAEPCQGQDPLAPFAGRVFRTERALGSAPRRPLRHTCPRAYFYLSRDGGASTLRRSTPSIRRGGRTPAFPTHRSTSSSRCSTSSKSRTRRRRRYFPFGRPRRFSTEQPCWRPRPASGPPTAG